MASEADFVRGELEEPAGSCWNEAWALRKTEQQVSPRAIRSASPVK
jgi:hypothetical protein